MNKVLISAVMVFGLLLLDAPEAAAHEDRGSQYRSAPYDSYGRDSYSRDGYRYRDSHRYRYDDRRDYYGSRHARANRMPRWLKRDKSFRHWFKHSRLRKNHRLSWHQLFDIYRWEHSRYRYRGH